jgi:DNA-binding helix-hairpin-helix protein with protein kinase domain
MTPPPLLVDTNGRPFPLDHLLKDGIGGEGAVYSLPNDATRAAKVYHPPITQTIEKLTAMIALANPALMTVSAWPTGLLLNARTRQLAGFVMPRLIDFQPIWQLYNPAQRLKSFPRAGWKFQVRAAQNLVAAFDEVHKAGCLVGDVNEKNAFVSSQALVRLIDCDSFQVRANGKEYLCKVGVPFYIPPELQGKSLGGLVRTENHDRFGLAVLLYQLLFVGRHPYAGVYRGSGDPSTEQLITEFRFAQGPLARSWGMEPGPHTPTFGDIMPSVGILFRRAFERGSETGTRPRALEWLLALKQLEQNTIECAADPGHTYWRGANKCVWCRLAEHGGPEYYYGVAGGVGTFVVDEARLQEVLRRLTAFQPINFGYGRDRFAPTHPLVAEPLPYGLEEHRNIATVLKVAIAFCLLFMPFGFIRGFIFVIGLLGAAVFGVWLGILHLLSPWYRERHRRRTIRNRALRELEQLEEDWQHTLRCYHRDHSELNRTLHGLTADCRRLTSHHQAEIQRLTANAEATARLRHLRLHLLIEADIPKIGAGRKQTLATYHIYSAADVDRNTIRGIKGFGDALTNNLIDWKESIIRNFRFEPATALSPAEQRSITVQFRARQQQCLAEVARQLNQLETLTPNCRAALQKLIPEVREAVERWEQANANLRLLTSKQ